MSLPVSAPDRDRSAPPPVPGLSLRPACPADEAFLFALYADVRSAEVQAAGWDAEQRAAFLTLQFRARKAHYARAFAGADDHVVMLGHLPIGRLLVLRGLGGIHLVGIEILSAHRERGIGARLLRELQDEAARAGLPLSLRVASGNPAVRLYERLGFRPARSEGLEVLMEWLPDGGPGLYRRSQ